MTTPVNEEKKLKFCFSWTFSFPQLVIGHDIVLCYRQPHVRRCTWYGCNVDYCPPGYHQRRRGKKSTNYERAEHILDKSVAYDFTNCHVGIVDLLAMSHDAITFHSVMIVHFGVTQWSGLTLEMLRFLVNRTSCRTASVLVQICFVVNDSLHEIRHFGMPNICWKNDK